MIIIAPAIVIGVIALVALLRATRSSRGLRPRPPLRTAREIDESVEKGAALPEDPSLALEELERRARTDP